VHIDHDSADLAEPRRELLTYFEVRPPCRDVPREGLASPLSGVLDGALIPVEFTKVDRHVAT